MRRPLPPELVALGDQLEAAAWRALARRRTRRQLFLNGVASVAVGIPLAAGVVSAGLTPPARPPAVATAAMSSSVRTAIPEDVLPRDLRRLRHAPQTDLLLLPSTYRRALR